MEVKVGRKYCFYAVGRDQTAFFYRLFPCLVQDLCQKAPGCPASPEGGINGDVEHFELACRRLAGDVARKAPLLPERSPGEKGGIRQRPSVGPGAPA